MVRRKLRAKRGAGGAQKKGQKMDLDAQPSSLSPSSFSNVEQTEMSNQEPSTSKSASTSAKTDNGPAHAGKKLREDSNFESGNQVEVQNSCFIDQLPPEMLLKILQYLNVKSLLASRLVSRKWNGIAREILESREDVQATFECYKPKGYKDLRIAGINNRRKLLSGFANAFIKASRATPLYTRFRFTYFEIAAFDHPNWINFISLVGPRIKGLKLEIVKQHGTIKREQELAAKLGDLLLNQLPNLQELGLQFSFNPWEMGPFSKNYERLFPKSAGYSNSNWDSGKTSTAQLLPHLKRICLQNSARYPGIVSDLLRASPNLQKLEHFREFSFDPGLFQDFLLFHEFGKLPCMETAYICLYHKFFPKDSDSYSIPLDFKLRKLKLRVNSGFCDRNIWSAASAFLSNIFESCKDSLTELDMEPFGFLPQLQLAPFSKLSKLSIFKTSWSQTIQIQVLPPGINLMETFPTLQHLELQVPWTAFFPHAETQNDSCIPNLKSLRITGDGMTNEVITQISHVCPNLKTFGIDHDYRGREILNFPEVGKAIWTHLKQLESLHLEIDLNSPANAFPALDSCFTGFSGEDCTRLYEELTKVDKSAEKQGSQSKSESKNQLNAERKNPSILNLKDLKDLAVDFHPYGRRRPEKMLIVSEKCAFQLMENLTYKIN